MDEYDSLLTDIVNRTKSGELEWAIVPVGTYSEHILNAPLVYQNYRATYELANRVYTLVFVEKKSLSIANDFDVVTERYSCEIIILSNNQLAFTLTKNYVDYDTLLELASLVERKSDKAAELFSHFKQPAE